MLTTRRDLLAGTGAIAALAACPLAAQASAPGDAAARAELDRIAEEILRDYPETAANMGIDKGPRAALRSRFGDRSAAKYQQIAARTQANLARLKAIDRAALSHGVALDVDVTQSAHEFAVEGYRTMPVGEVAVFHPDVSYRSTPYVVSQNSGAYVELPDVLENHHEIADAADAAGYLARIESFAAAVEGETGRLTHDQAAGVRLPGFLNDIATKQLASYQAMPPAEWGIVTGLRDKASKAGLPATYADRAAALIAQKVQPALSRQAAALKAARPQAPSDAGVWAQPNGDAYYSWLVKASTTTTYSPDELHRIGREQNAELSAQMDVLLNAQGLTQGTVGERLVALGKRPDLLFEDSDAGRAKLLAYLNGRVADIRTRLPRAFATMVKGNLVIRRVPPAIEDGMPNGYAGAGAIDGSTPGSYFINLKDMSHWPRYSLPTLTYHEGIPGHIWQGEYSYKLPLIRSLLAFNAFSEGWALYAEQLGDELGAYADDPLGKIGYLQSINFRAMRLVVDTGVHAKRWSFDQALRVFADGTGQPEGELRGELNRYCSWPGQACGYKMGHNEIVRLRGVAQAKMGKRFDLRTFDDAIVLGGNMPLTMLARVVDRYVAGA
jgi:uncharacterized protein (DUF885 family)